MPPQELHLAFFFLFGAGHQFDAHCQRVERKAELDRGRDAEDHHRHHHHQIGQKGPVIVRRDPQNQREKQECRHQRRQPFPPLKREKTG